MCPVYNRYSNGAIRIYTLTSSGSSSSSSAFKVLLQGHTSSVTSLRFSPEGNMLASGSADTDIVLWDVLAHQGLFRLKGHKDGITSIQFLSEQYLLSSSKDSFLKVWDLQNHVCLETVVGHRAEVWGCELAKVPAVWDKIGEGIDESSSNEKSEGGLRVITGAGDGEIRLWKVDLQLLEKIAVGEFELQQDDDKNDIPKSITLVGTIPRQTQGGSGVVGVKVFEEGRVLACQVNMCN